MHSDANSLLQAKKGWSTLQVAAIKMLGLIALWTMCALCATELHMIAKKSSLPPSTAEPLQSQLNTALKASMDTFSDMSPPPSSLILETRLPNGSILLQWHPSVLPYESCPQEPQPALVGIQTTLDQKNTVRREFLRYHYTRLNKLMQTSKQIETRFVLGLGKAKQAPYQTTVEMNAHLEDTVVTNRTEGVTNGKTLDWFQRARNMSYYRHPSIEGKWCRKFRYLGKADDDSIIHLERLSALLTKLSLFPGAQFVGRRWDRGNEYPELKHMTGMLYLTSLEVIEWLSFQPIPPQDRNKLGEDIQFARWIIEGNLSISWIDRDDFHDRSEDGFPVGFSHRPVGLDTVVVHHCKTYQQFFKCMWRLFDREFK